MTPDGRSDAFRKNGPDDRKATLHGVLVKVFDTGVLITGEARIGKSSCALELVTRGHSLVADDVIVAEIRDGKLTGYTPERFAGLLEVRGLGILEVRKLFGTEAFAPNCTIDLIVELGDREVSTADPYTAEYQSFELLGSEVRKLTLSAEPGRNLPILIETAVRLARNGSGHRVAEDHDALVSRESV